MEAKYIIYTEDGDVLAYNYEPTRSDYYSANDGLITILRLSDLHVYYRGDWKPIEIIKQQ